MSKDATLPVRGTVAELKLEKKLPKKIDAIIVAIFEGEDSIELAGGEILDFIFSTEQQADILTQLEAVGAKATANSITRVPGTDVAPVIAVGLGKADLLDDETLRRASGTAARSLGGFENVATTIGDLGLAAAVTGFGLGSYSYAGLRKETEESKDKTTTVTFISTGKDDKDVFVEAQIIVESVLLARDLVNTPSSHLYPESYSVIASNEASKHGLQTTILDEKQLADQGFGGILAVGNGSSRKPRLLRIDWKPRKAKKSIALVGKGITFDTGGISIKPGASMENMISDMGGSASVLATIIAAARLNLSINVSAFLPMAENMPSGDAFRPGDVITHFGGITSEILNTDAEGRLILADAIAYASEDKPDYLIDAATLTGAQLVALGLRTSGVMGTDEFRDSVAKTGREVGEQAWAMPLPEELDEQVKSPVADLRNVTNSRFAGMSAAGRYLQEFVGADIEWAHVDIAGPAYNTAGEFGYTPKRATGQPVRTFVQVLKDLSES
ncbi:leucyl aminopeptidase [Corynebacterium glutamicum]|uniref:Probable cytosol aminopeptidase n=1 Tax=Corynebacterium glutamicum (strain ATCC 13032 / DSM 20300 / JCM 1318 / BCRC 11384 / CCUG 27702 / LMG 3730 / NBRC 12168 / NCIMB 10025 / NRRL B-2784 / 534) TaxID=196627 RepID=AMPA_CORGL|nr:RecName: Full=Probable cytosol aminopeptidase; AltName: Full=Leucine aminopeptidase; Short=LAP; AltName: Full=Leucyl aminopeptidase [Corynebacterium glutamicum ATCC 13032]AMA01579.1 aminopeptidase [Corynebacterium glutamicum]CCH25344.1 leucyl aminopeptidase [Corynebacterium glutamicum K051]AUI02573.1 cytosol aminopeptidase [Corynebacterium glutamicum]AUI05631.1 cytosol aminopeptidase [Corynebacterium glutamicum]MBA4570421.1 leucyl aminopeptidase [Corynebacterium glutamicum]